MIGMWAKAGATRADGAVAMVVVVVVAVMVRAGTESAVGKEVGVGEEAEVENADDRKGNNKVYIINYPSRSPSSISS